MHTNVGRQWKIAFLRSEALKLLNGPNQFSTCSHGAHYGLRSIHVSRVSCRLLQRATLTERSWRRQDAFANSRDGSAPPEPGRLRSIAPSVWRYAERYGAMRSVS